MMVFEGFWHPIVCQMGEILIARDLCPMSHGILLARDSCPASHQGLG